MNKYHVDSGITGIYAGVLKNANEWKDRNECTKEAIEAVRDWMVNNLLGGLKCRIGKTGRYTWKLKDGRLVELRISVLEGDKSDDCSKNQDAKNS